jgi:hypothetical protein
MGLLSAIKRAGLVLGTNTNDAAAAGYVGEYLSANLGVNTAPGASNTATTFITLSLTAGDWDVDATVLFTPGTISTPTNLVVAVSKSNNAFDSDSEGGVVLLPLPNATLYTHTGSRRISFASTTNIYLVIRMNYVSVGTAVFNTASIIKARRVR